MIDPRVQQYGDVALLTYNLNNYGRLSGGPEAVLARWNSSEVYAELEIRGSLSIATIATGRTRHRTLGRRPASFPRTEAFGAGCAVCKAVSADTELK
jgi:hypothetical protein